MTDEREFDHRRALAPEFYDRPVDVVARELLGSWLVASDGNELVAGIIVETEAYGDSADLDSHAAFRKRGVVEAMWGAPGSLYVYRAFGMYPCFNVVTGPSGTPSAVLVRALSVTLPETDDRVASGPGRLGRTIGLTEAHNRRPLDCPPFWIEPGRNQGERIVTGRRVGVKRGDGRPWRFAFAGHPAVSRPAPA